MTPFTTAFAPIVALTGTNTGKWFRVKPRVGATHVPMNIDLASGTGTITLQGATQDVNTATITNPVTILSATATGGQIVGWYPYMRVIVTGATGLNAKVTLGVPMKQIEP